MSHTSEPWPKPFMPNHPAWGRGSNLEIGSLGLLDYTRARICVNACAGKTNEQLEGFAGRLFLDSEINLWLSYCEIKQQRDALLSAIEKYLVDGNPEGWDELKELIKNVKTGES
jgi:hypothetical protein